nr:amidase [Sphingomonas crusticola]
MPILIKDNIETRDMPTTAGSLALLHNAPGRDAPLVAGLRRAGAVILGKTNLTEWANFRSTSAVPGWSAVGGQTLNAYDPARTPCGSSSGSAVAVAIGLAPAAVGTETDGSIVCPASVNGVVGFKPTVGLVSRTHVIPISHHFDTPGPIARNVRDAARVLTAMAGSDPADPATADADGHTIDFAAALDLHALRGARIGVLRYSLPSYPAETRALFEQAVRRMRAAGAEIVDIDTPPPQRDLIGGWEGTVMVTDFKQDLNAYLASTRRSQVPWRTLAALITFNQSEPREMRYFKQESFENAERAIGPDDPAYATAAVNAARAAGPEGIDRMLSANHVDILVAPTTSRAGTLDRTDDDRMQGSAGQLPAVAGYPHLTVPMALDRGMPVGLSFIGTKWDDARVLSVGFAYEQLGRPLR